MKFDDFKVGMGIHHPPVVVTEDEMLAFAKAYDPQWFHIDHEQAKAGRWEGLIASGWHTCAMVMRMMCDGYLLRSASLGSPGIDNIRWLRPVRPGDVLRAQMVVLESRASMSKPDRGVVKSAWKVFNQEDELVMSMQGLGIFKRRHPKAPSR